MKLKQTKYECGFRLELGEGSMVPVVIEAPTPETAAEKFADYAHRYMGAWELGGHWDGDRAVAVRPVGRETFYYYEIERRVIPEFIATAE